MADKKSTLSDAERVKNGQILARIIIEVLGAPKDYVEEAVQLVIDKVHKIDNIDVVSESTYEAEQKGQLFATFSELELWFKDLDVLTQFLFDFTPSSVEIIQPSELSLSSNFMSGFMNDFLLKMHDIGLKLKDSSAKNQLLQKNADALVRNFLNHVLKEPKSAKDISVLTGIPEDNVNAMLKNFVGAGVVEEKYEKFTIVKK